MVIMRRGLGVVWRLFVMIALGLSCSALIISWPAKFSLFFFIVSVPALWIAPHWASNLFEHVSWLPTRTPYTLNGWNWSRDAQMFAVMLYDIFAKWLKLPKTTTSKEMASIQLGYAFLKVWSYYDNSEIQ